MFDKLDAKVKKMKPLKRGVVYILWAGLMILIGFTTGRVIRGIFSNNQDENDDY